MHLTLPGQLYLRYFIACHVNANMKLLDVRRKMQQILCIWRNIQNGFIEIYASTKLTRAGVGTTIKLPIPRTEQYKKSVFFILVLMVVNYGIMEQLEGGSKKFRYIYLKGFKKDIGLLL